MPGAKDELIQRLHSLRERTTNQTLAELGIVAGVEIDAAGIAQVRLRVNNPARSRKELEDDVKAAVRGTEGVTGSTISWEIDTPGREIGADDPVPEVKNVVLVMSGKGG